METYTDDLPFSQCQFSDLIFSPYFVALGYSTVLELFLHLLDERYHTYKIHTIRSENQIENQQESKENYF